MKVKPFTFNPFQENTYVLFDESKKAIIIDPGCIEDYETLALKQFIEKEELEPIAIINTHCHLDHVFGINALKQAYGLDFYCHEKEFSILESVPRYAPIYGIHVDAVEGAKAIDVEEEIQFGNTSLEIRFTPGHSPGSLCFIHHPTKQIIAGDVLFNRSIGRVDLPGGDYATLMTSIETELLSLPDDYKVYPGHGPTTTIGQERELNPFILEWLKEA